MYKVGFVLKKKRPCVIFPSPLDVCVVCTYKNIDIFICFIVCVRMVGTFSREYGSTVMTGRNNIITDQRDTTSISALYLPIKNGVCVGLTLLH